MGSGWLFPAGLGERSIRAAMLANFNVACITSGIACLAGPTGRRWIWGKGEGSVACTCESFGPGGQHIGARCVSPTIWTARPCRRLVYRRLSAASASLWLSL